MTKFLTQPTKKCKPKLTENPFTTTVLFAAEVYDDKDSKKK